MSAAGSGELGAESNAARAGSASAGTARGRGILVLGECLVDLAPSSPAPSGAKEGAAPTPALTTAGHQLQPGAFQSEAVIAAPREERQPRQALVALPGGGPANIAVGLARLEVPCAFAGRFSRGGFGPWLRQNLADNGVDLSFSVDTDEAATLALVTLDTHGRASYTFYGPTTADWQWLDSELPNLTGPDGDGAVVDAVHTGSLALALEPGATAITAWLTKVRQQGHVLISFDPNVRTGLVDDRDTYRKRLTSVVRSSHIVKASSEDVEAIYPDVPRRSVVREWLSLGVPLVIITEGSDGATAYHHSGVTTHCRPPPIDLADTIGAGDSFTSALLAYFSDHGLLSPAGIAGLTEAQLRSSVAQATTASALTCSRTGADPPTRLELSRFIDELN
jgi:fructokinase